jgi:hypothetical protein
MVFIFGFYLKISQRSSVFDQPWPRVQQSHRIWTSSWICGSANQNLRIWRWVFTLQSQWPIIAIVFFLLSVYYSIILRHSFVQLHDDWEEKVAINDSEKARKKHANNNNISRVYCVWKCHANCVFLQISRCGPGIWWKLRPSNFSRVLWKFHFWSTRTRSTLIWLYGSTYRDWMLKWWVKCLESLCHWC